jgi:hypothetical protein
VPMLANIDPRATAVIMFSMRRLCKAGDKQVILTERLANHIGNILRRHMTYVTGSFPFTYRLLPLFMVIRPIFDLSTSGKVTLSIQGMPRQLHRDKTGKDLSDIIYSFQFLTNVSSSDTQLRRCCLL